MRTIVAQKIDAQSYLLVFSLCQCLTLFALYIYLLSGTVSDIVLQKEINQEIFNLETEIATLESNYIRMQHEVSEEVASLDGFVAVGQKIFLNRGGDSLVLGANGI